MEHDTAEFARSTDRLFESSYEELCRVARRYPLAATSLDLADGAALVHETYILVRRGGRVDAARDRRRFLTLMTLTMRTVARDRWRRRTAIKRGGGRARRLRPQTLGRRTDLSTVDVREALQRLAAHDADGFAVVIHHDLLGRTLRETAELLDLTEAAVKSRRRRALAWLRSALGA